MTGHELAASLSVTVMRGRAITLKMKAFTVTFALIVVILFVVAFATLMVIFSPTLALALAPDVMFIRVAMTFDAVPEITNPLLDVLPPDVLGGMLVTAITGVLTIVAALVTGHALDIVVAV